MGGIRAWMVALAAACLIAPVAAWADPPAPPAYSPGDRVPFTVPDSERGDRYTVRIDGHQVVKGEDLSDDPGASGEYTMPDLGSSARQVTQVVRVVGSSDGPRSYETTVDYRPAPARPAPASKPAPRPPVPAPAGAPPAARPAPPSTPASGQTPTSKGPSERASSGRKTPRTPERILRGLGQAAPLRHRGTSAAHRKTKRHARHARHKANHFRAGPDPVPPKARSLSAPRDTRRNLSGSRFPGLGYSVAWKLLAIVTGVGLLLPFLVVARTHMRRRRELEMEAELQEIVAEGRAEAELPR
ncbi:MAG: hypothetical protein ACJ766_04370 [Thermoleophilaceae bacterium]